MMNINIPESSIDAFLNAPSMLLTAPSTFFDAPSTILKNPQMFDDAPLPSKASKVIYRGRSFQNHL
jgi:hypothetical protein